MTDLQILHRNHFRPLKNATARQIAGNCWEVRIPIADNRRWLPGTRASDFDDAIVLVDDEESNQVIGTREGSDFVVVTVVLS